MRRVSIVGSSGAGKSTVANALADRVGVPVIELDELMHGPDWTPTPTPEFRAKLMAAIAEADGAQHGWVIAGNYRTVADIAQGRADTIVWLDLPRRVSMWRLLKRSVRRVLTREELWNGNRESLRNLVSRDPNRNVLLWAWQHHPLYEDLYAGYANGDFWSHATVVLTVVEVLRPRMMRPSNTQEPTIVIPVTVTVTDTKGTEPTTTTLAVTSVDLYEVLV